MLSDNFLPRPAAGMSVHLLRNVKLARTWSLREWGRQSASFERPASTTSSLPSVVLSLRMNARSAPDAKTLSQIGSSSCMRDNLSSVLPFSPCEEKPEDVGKCLINVGLIPMRQFAIGFGKCAKRRNSVIKKFARQEQ